MRILILTIFLMGCSVLSYHKEFIDVKKTISLEIGMSPTDVEKFIGIPHHIELEKKDDTDKEIYKYYYNTREKVYNYTSIPSTDFLISRNDNIPIHGFSKTQRVLVLTFTDSNLTLIELGEETSP